MTLGKDKKQKECVKYRVIIEQDEDGMFIAEVPSLPVFLKEEHGRRL